MNTIYKITIPDPCQEDWDKMTPNNDGRFCDSCAKTVIDFSVMLPAEIQDYFKESGVKNLCGRFKKSQLDTLTIQIPSRVLYSQTNYHKMFLLALFVAMGTTLFSCKNNNNEKQKIDKVEIVTSVVKPKDSLKKELSPTFPNPNLVERIEVPKPPSINRVEYESTIAGNIGVYLEPPIEEDSIKFVNPKTKSKNCKTIKAEELNEPIIGILVHPPIIDSTKTEKK